ncbi:uncharacterized protein BJ171DRAFT_446277 [Polychytrium aggregatum]|uniref:uncharacterized protein n=1 Tax=Polychytrium aggregatum TaxID=110093 RepID=UPI0022FDDD1A|nr:uncharacterized protein BJ171DRAFT_446277 [Polychytrium aggregatum]KAI9197200.1 hypothetical protein BJ171DRAFT_446277 [Polychytrium aggregatum]
MAASVHHSANMARPAINEHIPDIFTIICCNDSFQAALDHNTIKILLRVCKRARPLLSSKVPRFHRWCQSMELLNLEGQLRIGLTPSDQIALSQHCKNPDSANPSWLIAQANRGNAAASYFMARILDSQRNVTPAKLEVKRHRTFRFLEKATNTNHTMAQLHLAECYHNGFGVDRDQIKAVDMFRSLAERGIPQAHIALGRCYESGEGVDQDFDVAIEWYSKAADQGSEDGRLHIIFLRGWFSFIGHGVEQSDVDAFHHWQEVSSKSTDPIIKPIATHMVGWMHYLGRGTVQDKQKGIEIIRVNKSHEFKFGESECLAYRSSTSSYSLASHNYFQLCQLGSNQDWLCKHLMAVCLFHGFGSNRDLEKAAGIFEQLANDGHSDSQLWLGECHHHGAGISKDEQKAFEWYCKSADQDNSYGQFMVGLCSDLEDGFTKDHSKEAEWYHKSAEQGNRHGQWMLGFYYEHGIGVPQNIDTAILWFRNKSANQGNSYGQWMVGRCYFNGYGVDEDKTMAVEWFRKSAEQENRYAQDYLGYCYYYGYGVPQNIDTAIFWCRKSADQGLEGAINKLKTLGKWGGPDPESPQVPLPKYQVPTLNMQAAKQPSSQAAKQPSSQAAKQPSSQAAKQPSSQAAKQPTPITNTMMPRVYLQSDSN